MDSHDRQRLVTFVVTTREDLPFIFDAAGPYMAPDVAQLIWPAWEAVQTRGDFEALVAAIEGRAFDERLDEVGLSGPELDFKLAGVEAARATGRETRSPRLLKRWLKWIDVILGSLLSAIGVGEAITELKEGVEADLEGEDDAAP